MGTRDNEAAISDYLVDSLRCEYRQDPVGIDVRRPRLSWKLSSSNRGAAQTGYQILVTDCTL